MQADVMFASTHRKQYASRIFKKSMCVQTWNGTHLRNVNTFFLFNHVCTELKQLQLMIPLETSGPWTCGLWNLQLLMTSGNTLAKRETPSLNSESNNVEIKRHHVDRGHSGHTFGGRSWPRLPKPTCCFMFHYLQLMNIKSPDQIILEYFHNHEKYLRYQNHRNGEILKTSATATDILVEGKENKNSSSLGTKKLTESGWQVGRRRDRHHQNVSSSGTSR